MATLSKMADVLGDRLPLIYSTIIVLGITFLAQLLFSRDPLSKIPIAGAELGGEQKRRQAYLLGAKAIYDEAYKRFKDTICKITTTRDSNVIIVPARFLNELKKLPDDTLSFSKAIEETMVSKYTKIVTDEAVIPHTIKSSLTPGLVRLNPILTEEVARTVQAEIPPCVGGWTEVNINQRLLRIVAIVSGRIFLGPELCHDEAYIDAAVNYTLDLVALRDAVLRIRPWLRPFVVSRLPEQHRLTEREARFAAMLGPVVTARRAAAAADPHWDRPDDMLQWLIEGQAKFGDNKKGDMDIAKMQLGLSFAAIHTTVMTATNAFYDLAANPDLVPILREECATVLADNGGVFTSPGLQSMKKVDSFLKETIRMNPGAYTTFQRKVLKTFALSNGQVIPAGVTLEVPNYGSRSDPVPFPEPDRFDGLRFFNMREASLGRAAGDKNVSTVEAIAHNQFVSVSQTSLTFGFGRHACPGRFFAINELKMIFARVLLHFDIKLAGDAVERYPNIEFAGSSMPDPRLTILMRARQ